MGMKLQVFQRYEKKYLLTESQYSELIHVLTTCMTLDQYGKHTICNIYFDTPDYRLIKLSLQKPEYKEKLRLRSYGVPADGDTVFVEIKKKCQGIVYKRRVPMTLEDARKYLYYGIYPELDNQVVREVDYVRTHYQLKPAAYLSYDRLAYFCNEMPQLRVTFDSKLNARQSALHLDSGNYGTLLLKERQVLMEVKIPGAMPLWMSHLFSELGIYSVSYSKYGTYYKEYLHKSTGRGGVVCA